MAEGKPIPVRLSPDLITRLDRSSKRIGSNRAALIRFCVEGFLEHFEKHGGIASLPLNWQQIMQEQDGRRKVNYGDFDDSPTLRVAEGAVGVTISHSHNVKVKSPASANAGGKGLGEKRPARKSKK